MANRLKPCSVAHLLAHLAHHREGNLTMEYSADTPPREEKARGLWFTSITFTDPPPGVPKRKRFSAKTKAGAVDKRREFIKSLIQDGKMPGKSPTLEWWLWEWFNHIAPKEANHNTLATYRGFLANHIIPAFGHKRMDKLTPNDIRGLEGYIRGKGLSGRTAEAAFNTLRLALNEAVAYEYIPRNPAAKVHRPTTSRPDTDALSAVEARKVIATAAEQWGPMATRWSTALMTGARQGEILGLTWDRVDLDAGTIHFNRQLDSLPYRHGCGEQKDGVWPCRRKRAGSCPSKEFDIPEGRDYEVVWNSLAWTPVKTRAGMRLLPMPTPVWESLRYHREHTWVDNPWGLVWVRENGTPWPAKDDWAEWGRLLGAAGVRQIKQHATRHTTVTLLIDAGVPPAVVQQIVGHSSVASTEHYMHSSLDRAREALDQLGRELHAGDAGA